MKTARRREKDSWSHLYSTLGCCSRRGKGKAAQRKRQRRRREKEKGLEGAGHTCFYRRNLNIQRPRFKLFIRDPSDLRIQHVNSKMVTFLRDLRIHGLRSTIRATVQKVKFFVNSGASFYFFGVTRLGTCDFWAIYGAKINCIFVHHALNRDL
jgi:hypothetical protein